MVIKLARPPTDLNSFLGRKWLESLTNETDKIAELLGLPFILAAPNADLTGSRYIAVDSSLTLVDGGAQQPITISLKLSNPNIFTAHNQCRKILTLLAGMAILKFPQRTLFMTRLNPSCLVQLPPTTIFLDFYI